MCFAADVVYTSFFLVYAGGKRQSSSGHPDWNPEEPGRPPTLLDSRVQVDF